jgi:hypothetical protein
VLEAQKKALEENKSALEARKTQYYYNTAEVNYG